MNEKNIKVLAAQIRLETLKVIHSRGFGHVGGSMDLADLMAVLYGEVMKYDPKNPESEPVLDKVIDFPCTASKFDIIFDEKSKKYITIASRALDESQTVRNLLSLFSSDDLINWKLCRDLIDRRYDDPKMTGFQYVDFIIDGEDILYLCRTAYNSPNNFHNSNYTTFHKIEYFREII